MAEHPPTTSSPLLIAGAWIIVVVPAIWGLTFTVQNAMKIFNHTPIPTTAPASVPAGH